MIQGVDKRLRPSDNAERHFTLSGENPTDRRHHLVRGAAIGAAGLLLSAIFTSLFAPDQKGSADAHPPDGLVSFLRAAVLPVVGWLIGAGLAWLVWEYGFRDKQTGARVRIASRNPKRTQPHPRVLHGTHASALAICLMALGTWWASTTINDRTVSGLWRGHSPRPTRVTVTDGQWSSQSPYLAGQFEPQFRLATHEPWSPTSVTYYRLNSHEVRTTPFCSSNGCLQLNRCSDGSDPKGCPPNGDNDLSLYYRYVDATNADVKGIVDPTGPWKLIQYWIFYNYDSLSAGAITQWHQADWEQVSVLVERTGATVRPVEVAFSEHCYGARLSADRVQWSGSQPISYVGKGSHANYPRPVSVPVRELRCSLGGTPRYLGAAGLFFSPAVDGTSLELPVDYLLGIRDHTAQVPSSPMPRLIALDSTPVVSVFNGSWGPDNNLRLFGHFLVRPSAGPQAPEQQPVSQKPFHSMLCNSGWLNPGGQLPDWICRAGRS